jgi:hypothetical protein
MKLLIMQLSPAFRLKSHKFTEKETQTYFITELAAVSTLCTSYLESCLPSFPAYVPVAVPLLLTVNYFIKPACAVSHC